ncbi:hypothetical protein [Leifsonia sp. SIMBA_070]|uniref:hypothetical protein n=1 Tax=Leifsonia sp. SIMBA_070 TaxID=3085810 RepID=UPI00397AD9FB
MNRTSQPSRSRASRSTASRSQALTLVELRRAASALARDEGWRTEPMAESSRAVEAPPEVRLVVRGAGLPGTLSLRVRERPPGSNGQEITARRAAESEHVIGVVRELPCHPVRGREVEGVLLQHSGGGELHALLDRESGLRGGEAVTVLLGVAAGVAALHRSGWAGPDLSVDGVVFARDGCPALDGMDDVRPFGPDAAIADAEAFHSLARVVCLRVSDGSGMLLLSAVESGLRRGRWPAVEEAVLAAVPPEPVDVGLVAEPDQDAGLARGPALRRPPGGRGAARAGRLLELLDGEPVRELTRRLVGWARRRPALVVAALVPAGVGLAIVALLPAAPAERAAAAPAGPTASSHPPRSSAASPSAAGLPTGAELPTGAGSPSTAAPSAGAASPTGAGSPSAAAPAATSRQDGARPGEELGSDDPVDAARAVLDARYACFAVRPVLPACLSRLLDGDAALMDEEAAATGSATAAQARDYRGAALSLVERWGDAALVSVVPDTARTPHSEPASLLLVRSEAGWRLRAVYP